MSMKSLRAAMLFQLLQRLPFLRRRPLVSGRVGWGVAALVLTIWSAFCAAAYGLVQLIGNWAITAASYGANWNVDFIEFLTAALSLTQNIGHFLVGGVWVLGALVVVAVTWFLTSFRTNRSSS